MSQILDSKQIKAALKDLPEWDLEKNAIERTFEFDDFAGAIDFVNGVAELAEEMEHHPDMDIRYSKVRVILSTHSKGGLTEMDFELAERIGNLVDA
jgi:4a-hydroxytetrahydrobiopterin dehydratase